MGKAGGYSSAFPFFIENRIQKKAAKRGRGVKNKRDRLYFTQLFVPQASQSA